MRQQRELNDDEKQAIIRMRDEGMSKNNIAKEIGCGNQVIIKFLNEYGDINMSSGRKKLTLTQRMNNKVETIKCREDVDRLIRLYKLAYSIEDIAKSLKMDVCEVEEAIQELNIFKKLNKDMTCRGQKANENYMAKLMGGGLEKYPYLKMRLGKSNILYNAMLKDMSGNEVTRFDIVIPQLGAIIINGKRYDWLEKHKEDQLLNDYLCHIGSPNIFFTNDEPADILAELEGRAKFMEQREMRFSHRYGFRKEIWRP